MTANFIFRAAATLVAAAQAVVAQPAFAQTKADDEWGRGFISTTNRCQANGAQTNSGVLDGYTRLEFSSNVPVPSGLNYANELRNPVSRFFSGKSVTRALSLNATYSRHKVDSTTTVVSLSHKSSRKGYEWSSEVSNQRLITPYFRIDQDGVVRTSWKLAMNKTYDMSAVQDLLKVVKRATNLLTPSSGLLTSLNAEQFKETSQFVDQSVSSFLRESIDEIAPDEFPLAACAGKDLVSLTLVLPKGANVVRNAPGNRPVGTWTVRLAPPIRSIFSPQAGLSMSPSLVSTSVGAGTIFDYQVGDKLSLGQVLGGDSAITAVRDEFKGTSDNAAMTASKLCALLVGKLQAIGLNRFDTAVAIYAFADQYISNAAHRGQLLQQSNCSILLEA